MYNDGRMADTLQCVAWCIECACPFRQGAAVSDVHAAHGSVQPLHVINVAAANNDIYGDYCVTDVSGYQGGRSPIIGARVSEAAAPVGSLEEARRVCGQCPANASARSGEMAGCCGRLFQRPDDAGLERQISRAIAAHGLAARAADAFLKTTPQWYGFWARSPLSVVQIGLLREIVPTLSCSEGQVPYFRRACEIATSHGFRIHVALAPPGHTDFGYYTVFAHCPRCMRLAGKGWDKASPDPTTCDACGHVFVPADTASESKDVEPAAILNEDSAEYQALRGEWKLRHGGDVTWDPIVGPPNTIALEAQDRAIAREFVIGCIVAVAAVVALVVLAVSLVIRHATIRAWMNPQTAVLILIPACLVCAWVALLALTGTTWLVNQIHGLLGFHVCAYCHRPLRFADALCDCPQSSEWREIVLQGRHRRRRRRLRRCRRLAKPVLLAYALIATAVLSWTFLRRSHPDPWPVDLVVSCVVIPNGIGVVLMLVADLLKWLGRPRRQHLKLKSLGTAIFTLAVVAGVIALAIYGFARALH